MDRGNRMEGIKYDNDKPRWDLLPMEQLEEVVKVLSMGAKKYADENWKKLDNLQQRYYGAALRHIVAWKKGEIIDSESGLPHLAHAICCLMFIMWKDDNND